MDLPLQTIDIHIKEEPDISIHDIVQTNILRNTLERYKVNSPVKIKIEQSPDVSLNSETIETTTKIEQELNIEETMVDPVDIQENQIEMKEEPELNLNYVADNTAYSTEVYQVILVKNKSVDLKTIAKTHVQCELCRKNFFQNCDIKNLISTPADTVGFDQCNICNTHVSLSSKHIYIHTGQKPYTCKLCLKSFTQIFNLKKHIEWTGHTHILRIMNYKCNICSKGFKLRVNLRKHMLIHTNEESNEKIFECYICSKQYSLIIQLKDHMNRHTGERPYKCKYCPKFFTTEKSLETHRLFHTVKKPHQCHICLKRFTWVWLLKQHMNKHNGIKPYQCNICPKSFLTSGQIRIHKSTHTGKYPYTCTICSKGFILRSPYNIHMNSHKGLKPYKCKICSKCFLRPSSLRSHLITHTGKKPHQCPSCPKGFIRPVDLKDHINTHTGVEPYECNLCLKSFCTHKGLRVHRKSHLKETNSIKN